MSTTTPPLAAQQSSPDSMKRVAKRLRILREERGLTLRQAAARSGLSHSFIGQVEAGTTEIAVSRLLRLADAYGVLITELLNPPSQAEVELTKAEAATCFPGTPTGVTISPLASPSFAMQPFRLVLDPGAQITGLTHANEEFVVCVKGTVRYLVEDDQYVLKPGDTLYLPGGAVHGYVNERRTVAVLIGATNRALREQEPNGHERADGVPL